ncbi:MAG: TIGR03118 family protein [Deltaproteobacteria bacterium]|nr:TIGR03118 family protein [Deltaproteobacteria bacterium]MBV8454502.1 TIGR03118 family protein [Deltaproteobacteria bacterium]
MKRPLRNILTTVALAAGLVAAPPRGGYASGPGYVQKNLITNDKSKFPAAHQDTTLLNPWGIAFFPGGPFWINDNNFGVSALYNGDGTGVGGSNPALAVTIPTPKGVNPPAAPTGIVASTSFKLKRNGSSTVFIFATEDGTISAWNGGDGIPGKAELEVDNSTEKCSNGAVGAVYKGLASGVNKAGVFLYATNFRCATVDVFDTNFNPGKLSGKFQDNFIPNGFAPFGIANIRGNLAVTYAKQNAEKHDDVAGRGNGFVDIFDTDGHMIERFATRGPLNSPWAVAEAPFNFGKFSNDLLIGNFGNGWINAFESDRSFQGPLTDTSNNPIAIDGLWALAFGGGSLSSPSTLYFTSGPEGETDGLVGTLTPQ